jgi:nucleotide-binding universal stress UspA family protein
MLKLILVPLDGSGFGEQALPTAQRIAERERAEIDLVHVFEPTPPYLVQGAAALDPTLDLDLEKDRKSYLNAIAGWLRDGTTAPVKATLLEGPVAETLIDYINKRHADLVVMTTHGRGGLSRVWLGSVASDVMRNSSAPVLLTRPDESSSRTRLAHPFGSVLVPLDGSPSGEEALDHAMAVAGDKDVEYVLLHVITPILYMTDPVGVAYPEQTEAELQSWAESYLNEAAARVRARGFAAETRILRHPHPARAILECAVASGADLIAMETHGRGGLARVLMGSVTDKVVRGSPVPVLVHRPRAEAVQSTAQRSEEGRETGWPRS